MNVRRCNGCMKELVRNDEEFHWCMSCAIIAFNAVEDAAASRG